MATSDIDLPQGVFKHDLRSWGVELDQSALLASAHPWV